MLWRNCVRPLMAVSALIVVLEANLASGQEIYDFDAQLTGRRLAMARSEHEEQTAVDPATADMQAGLSELRTEMSRMKRSYDLKLAEMKEKVEALEDEKKREDWGKLETMHLVRPVSAGTQMTPEERSSMEEEFRGLMGQPSGNETQPDGTSPTPKRKGILSRILPVLGGQGGASQTYNPDISVIGDFLGTFIRPGTGLLFEDGGFEKNEFADRFSFREVELTFQSVIDPYARADFILTMEDASKFEIEEGTLTLISLPYGIQPKAGIFKAAFGKINRTHRPELPFVDYPNVVKNLLGPDGLKMTGLSVSWLVPNPWDMWIEATGEVSTPTERDTMFLMHLKAFHDITPNSSLQVGISGATGVMPEGLLADNQRRVDMEGFNITYAWKPVTERLKPYRSFVWQTEVMASQPHDRNLSNAWGGYTFAEYQLTRRNHVGLRLDYSQFLTHRKGDYEAAVSPYWTFWQSDFARYRLTYTHTERNITEGPGGDDAVMMQATFSIGAHRPHPY